MKQITVNTKLVREIGETDCYKYGCGNPECVYKCLKPKKIYKTYSAVEIDEVIYWIDETPLGLTSQFEKVAQSKHKINGLRVINLDNYQSNPVQYTQKDLDKAIELARTITDGKNEFDVENILGSSDGTYGIRQKYTEGEILKQLNEILTITVDNNFNIISYE